MYWLHIMFELLIKWTHWLLKYYNYFSTNEEMKRGNLVAEKVHKYSTDIFPLQQSFLYATFF